MTTSGKNHSRHINALVLIGVAVVLGVFVWKFSKDGFGRRSGLGIGFEDPSAVAAIDPQLMICEELPRIPVKLESPIGLAVGPGDKIYVCGAKSLDKMSADGSRVWRAGLNEDARCVAVASNGTIYLGMSNHVEVLDENGNVVKAWDKVSDGASLVSIAADGEHVYVSDAAGLMVVKYDLSGRVLSKINGFVLFGSPCFDVAIDPGGRLWVANPGARELRKYGPGGELVASWRRASRSIDGFSGCCNPVHVAFRPDGTIVTSEKHIVRVKIIRQDGSLVGVVAAPGDFKPGVEPADVACDSKGRIFLLDAKEMVVRVFAEKKRDGQGVPP